jgi:sodium pump decarboxylase gamma subunit
MNKAVALLAQSDPSVWMVAGLGVAVVFVGLVSIVGLVWAMNKLCDRFLGTKPKAVAPAAPVAPAANAPIANREEIVAAVCAAVAEEEGVDISALRVVSFKKL